MPDPYRIPDAQILPDPIDFAYAVFSTDTRVIEFAKARFEIGWSPTVPKGFGHRASDFSLMPPTEESLAPPTEEEAEEERRKAGEALLRQAVLRLWHMAKKENELPQRGHKKSIELVSYQEAQILSQRVGKRWDSTPIPTLVEALSDDELLHCMAFPRVTLAPESHTHVTAQPYLHIRPRRLILGDEYESRKLGVSDFRIGKNSMFANSNAIPGCCFSNRAFPYRLNVDTCAISQYMTLVLINYSSESVTVSPMVYGIVRRGDW